MNRDMNYEFKGFIPDDFVRAYVARIAEELYFASPSDSGLNLMVEKGKHFFKATCRIASQVGVFTAEAISENVVNAVENMREKIDRQLKSWKSQRFCATNSYKGENVPWAS